MENTNYRDLFHLPKGSIYLLAHSIGLMPKNSEQALNDGFAQHWKNGSDNIWPLWLSSIAAFNQELAKLLNSEQSQFCPQSNVSSALTKVVNSLPEKTTRKTIVASENDFPSIGFVLQEAQKLGYSIKWIPKEEDAQDLNVWRAALSHDVHSALITHVHYNTNKRIPVKEISELCREQEIISIVDVAQSVGIVPIDLAAWQADIVIGSCIKWLCGGPGAAWLWLDSNIIEQLEPSDLGWFSHENPFEFDIHNFEYAKSAKRFWGGTPSVAPYVVASNSIKLISNIGVGAIADHNETLTQKLLSALAPENVVSPSSLEHKGGTTVLKFEHQGKIEQQLIERNILFDSREYGIRLSPHIYTLDDDIEQLIEICCD